MSEKSLVVNSEDLPRFQQEWARDFPEHDVTDPRTLGPVKRLRNSLRRKAFERMATEPVHDRSRGKIDGRDVRRILIVRYDAIGDYVVTTPLEQWLRAAIPHAEIDMITSPRNDSVARLDPNLANTYPVDYDFRLRTPGRLKNIQPARERNYDLLFALTTTRM